MRSVNLPDWLIKWFDWQEVLDLFECTGIAELDGAAERIANAGTPNSALRARCYRRCHYKNVIVDVTLNIDFFMVMMSI